VNDNRFIDAHGREIEMGFLVTSPANVKNGKPVMFKGIAVVVGRHAEENNVFIRYMGDEMVHLYHPAKLAVLAPQHRDIKRHRQVTSLATAA
jgi:hypothetical protein